MHVSLPIYSGGLGALAGDLLKEASDQALPLVAVGLMYRKGYFRQRIDASGWQHEYWIDTDPDRLPAALVTGPDGDSVTITVPIGEVDVTARIWRVDVGRVPLFLLDSDCPANGPLERWITGRLYDGDPQTRLAQYALLGAGGVRALRAMGYEPGVIHLNEGHAALAPLELARGDDGDSMARRWSALASAPCSPPTRRCRPATTPIRPTRSRPPPAAWRSSWAARRADLIALGGDGSRRPVEPVRGHPGRAADEPSLQRGQPPPRRGGPRDVALAVARPRVSTGCRSATSPTACTSPPGWARRCARCSTATCPRTGAGAPTIRRCGPECGKSRRPSCGRHDIASAPAWWSSWPAAASATAWAEATCAPTSALPPELFDPDSLTLGFARRVATYKRLDLLTRDPDWTIALLAGDRPVQVILAGKAHPRDEEAKRVLQSLFGMKRAEVIGERVVFLDDYDLYSAARLVRGCDVWLNLPRPPLEASGTSGMKSAFNGGLQLSVLDGWWAEGYDGTNGWAIPGEVESDHAAQDERDAAEFHRLLDEQVVPAFYERGDDGLPARWIELMRNSLRTLGPRYCATRMLNEYVEGPYRGARPDGTTSELDRN